MYLISGTICFSTASIIFLANYLFFLRAPTAPILILALVNIFLGVYLYYCQYSKNLSEKGVRLNEK